MSKELRMPVHRSESCAKRHRIEQLNMQAQGRGRRSGQKGGAGFGVLFPMRGLFLSCGSLIWGPSPGQLSSVKLVARQFAFVTKIDVFSTTSFWGARGGGPCGKCWLSVVPSRKYSSRREISSGRGNLKKSSVNLVLSVKLFGCFR